MSDVQPGKPIHPRWLLMIAAGSLALFFTGCSSQDFVRPMGGIGDIADSGKPYVQSDDEEKAKARAGRLAEMLASWQSRESGQQDYFLGADDVVELSVLSLDKPGEVSVLRRTIGRDGMISLPLIGDVRAAGASPRELQAIIMAAYKDKYIKDPEVSLKVVEYRSMPVVVTGALNKPGVYYLRRMNSSVLEILAEADGLSAAAGDTLIIVRGRSEEGGNAASDVASSGRAVASVPDGEADAARFALPPEELPDGSSAKPSAAPAPASPSQPTGEPDMISINLEQLLSQGDIRQNVPVRGGDIISVPPARKQYFYVLGYVRSPGSFEWKEGSPVDALQAVAMAGGLTPSARASNSVLISERTGKREITSVDLSKIASGARPTFYVRPGDTLIVGSGLLARLGEFVKPTMGASVSAAAPVP